MIYAIKGGKVRGEWALREPHTSLKALSPEQKNQSHVEEMESDLI